MYVKEQVVEAIKTQIDIVSVIGRYIKLEKRGDKYWGCCPFHHEKTPSFVVTPARGSYYCFGCKVGGDIFTFIGEMEHLTFPETLKQLASQAGIAINEENNEHYTQEQKQKKAILELNQRVNGLYEHLLWFSAEGEEALNYLDQRGLSQEIIKTFHIGYTHAQGDWLYQFLLKKNYSRELLAESGLFSKNKPQYTLFRNRISFPIFNKDSFCVGFSCRAMPNDQNNAKVPKYINTPDTVVYHKKELVYGLQQALTQLKTAQRFILCEGSMDVCALHQMGYKEAVAPLGSAFTNEQAKLLKRYTNQAVLLFDNDSAGQKAAFRGAIVCEQEEIASFVAKMSTEKDPAELLEKKESYLLTKIISSARMSFDFFLTELMMAEKDQESFQADRLSRALFPYILAVQSPIKKESYLRNLAVQLNLSFEAIFAEFTKFKKEHHYSYDAETPPTVPADAELKPVVAKQRVIKGQTYELLANFLQRPDLYKKYAGELEPSYFIEEEQQEILTYLKEQEQRANIFNFIENVCSFNSIKLFLGQELQRDQVTSCEEKVQRYLEKIKLSHLQKRHQEIVLLIDELEVEDSADENIERLLLESAHIAKEIQVLKKRL